MHIIAKRAIAQYKKKLEKERAAEEAAENDDGEGACECIVNTCSKFLPCVCAPVNQPIPKSLWKRMWFQGTIANKRVKVVLGFTSGVFLTMMIFYVMMVLFQASVIPGLITVGLIATFLPYSLAFYPKVRAVTLLTLPSLVTDKGQALIIAYMLVNVINGPIENFHHNVQMLAISSLCVQEQSLRAYEERVDAAKRPLHVISKRMEDVMDEYKKVAKETEKKIDKMAENFENIMDEFKRFKEYYDEVKNYCVEKHGTSDELRCSAAKEADYDGDVDKYIEDVVIVDLILEPILEDVLNDFKDSTDKALCKSKSATKDLICNTDIDLDIDLGIDLDVDLFADTRQAFREKTAKMKREVRDFFEYNVTFDRKSDLNRVRSINFTTIINNIRAELLSRVQIVTMFLQIAQYSLVFFSGLVVLMAMLYLHKYHTKLNYDNRYINQFIIDLDTKRTQLHKDKESIFPMSRRERFAYIKPTSRTLSRSEVFRTILNLLLILPMLINLILVAFGDIGLWYILTMSGDVIAVDIAEGASGKLDLSVEGNGSRADSYNNMLSKFSSGSNGSAKSAMFSCYSVAKEPDWGNYFAMCNLIVYVLLLAIFQSYILRLRQVICSLCYPERARERAAYLYNQILQLRGSLLSFLRRQIRRATGKEDEIERVSLCHSLGARFAWLRPLVNALGFAQKYCLGCGAAGGVKDLENFVHCRNYGCKGVYCKACSNDLNNLCTACMHPIDYGDFGDISEEWDSSSDDDELMMERAAEPEQQKRLSIIQVQAQILREMLRRLHNKEQGLHSSSSSCSTVSSCSECYQLPPIQRHRHRSDSTEMHLGSRENMIVEEPSEYLAKESKRKLKTRSSRDSARNLASADRKQRVDLEEIKVDKKPDQKKTKKRRKSEL